MVRAQFRPAFLSVELSIFLNCDPTLIYLLRRVRAKAQKGVGARDLLEIGGKYGSSHRIYCLNSYENNSISGMNLHKYLP